MSKRFIDLTFPIHGGMTTFPVPWHPFVEISILGRHGIENRETRKLVLGTHTGTHLDAPRHFVTKGQTVDALPLEVLVGPAMVLDFSSATAGQEIGIEDIERPLGPEKPERIILRFDWDRHWGKMEYYSNHPFLSQKAARWLVEQKVKMVTMDTPMPDNPKHGRGNDPDSPNHKIFLENKVIIVEYLCNLKALTKKTVELIVLPLKIQDGDGSPVRCIAIEES